MRCLLSGENLCCQVICTVNCKVGFDLFISGKVRFLASASYEGNLSSKEDSSIYTAVRVGRKKLLCFTYFEVELE